MITNRTRPRLLLAAAALVLLAAAQAAPASARETAAAMPAPAADHPDASRTRFVRVTTDADGLEEALEVSIVGYVPEAGGGRYRVDLVSAVHVADQSYYQGLNRRFRDYDAVLYELVVVEPDTQAANAAPAAAMAAGGADDRQASDGDGDNGKDRTLIGSTQVAMKDALGLAFQLDQIDYSAPNFMHADLTQTELRQSMAERDESLYVYFWRVFYASFAEARRDPYGIRNLQLMTRLLASGHPDVPKVMLAHELARMDRPRAILDAGSGSAIIDSRNQRAIDVLAERIAAGDRRIAIFYGAAHMPDMEARLVDQLGLVRDRVEWIEAWDLAAR